MAVDLSVAARVLEDAAHALAWLCLVRGTSRRTHRRMARAAAMVVAAAALLGASPAGAVTPVFVPSNPAVAFGNAGRRSTPAFADLDGDGDLDAFIGDSFNDTVFFENRGDPSSPAFAAASANPFGLDRVGNKPAFADIDGDGDLDAFVGAVFFENSGDSSAPAFAASSFPNPFGLAGRLSYSSPAFVDIDGDGDLDAFISEYYVDIYSYLHQGTVFFENTGDSSSPAFAAPSSNPFGLGGGSTAFADVDGDGDLDVFVGRYYVDFFSISQRTFFVENTGDASSPAFAAAASEPFGLGGGSPAFADIDGDGDLDAFSGTSYGTTDFFENTGDASSPAFAASPVNPFGLIEVGGFSSPAFADIDGDGDLDAFIGEGSGSTLFFANAGDASSPAFQASSPDPFGLIDVARQSSPAFADIDADGDLDVFIGENCMPPCPSVFPSNAIFLENTGNSSSPAFFPTPFGLIDVGDFSSPALADIDADGDLDAFIGDDAGDTVFFENTADSFSPAFATPSVNPFGLGGVGSRSSPAFTDIDGDGDLDALIGNDAGDTIFFENVGDASSPVFAASSANPFGLAGLYSSSPAFADIDGDGDPDAFIGTRHTIFFENTGNASSPAFAAFGTSSVNPFGLADLVGPSRPTFADIDADGDLDAFIGASDATVFFENVGDASSPAFAASAINPFGLVNVGFYDKPAFADIDGDGDLDAFIGGSGGRTIFFENTGNASSPAFLPNPFGLTRLVDSPSLADIDHDGDLDAFVGQNGETVFFENAGDSSSPAFAESSRNPFGLFGFATGKPTFADIDFDGDLDAFIGALFFENTGNASLPAFAASFANAFGLVNVGGFNSPVFADIDSDGDLDAFIGRRNGETVFFENRSPPAVPVCAGDCDGNERVEVDELILGVTVSLGTADASACLAMDADGDGQVSIDELVRAVGNALRGC